MFEEITFSGGSVSSLSFEEPPFEPVKLLSKSSLAVACTLSLFLPAITSAAITEGANEGFLSDYATISEVNNVKRMVFVSEALDVVDVESNLDLLFPQARISNEYEQKIVAELINDFFE